MNKMYLRKMDRDKHIEIGKELKREYLNLITIGSYVSKFYPKKEKIHRLLGNLLEMNSKVRCELDNFVHREHTSSEENSQPSNARVYYGADKEFSEEMNRGCNLLKLDD